MSSISMHMQNLDKIQSFILKVLSGNKILTSFKGRNPVTNWRKWTLNNPKLQRSHRKYEIKFHDFSMIIQGMASLNFHDHSKYGILPSFCHVVLYTRQQRMCWPNNLIWKLFVLWWSKHVFWSALFKNDKLFFLNVRASEKNLSDADIQKAISCQHSMKFPDPEKIKNSLTHLSHVEYKLD